MEIDVWRIGKKPIQLSVGALADEERLEDFLAEDISIASPNWMVIGRQVPTSHGKSVDLLAIDGDGHLIVLELKRHKTPREVVAQLLDYGSWVRELEDADIAKIYESYLHNYHQEGGGASLDEAFCRTFDSRKMPEALNESHELVIVASALDNSTERIVSYLAEEHGVTINAIFFRVFSDGNRQYLCRAWLRDPVMDDGGKPGRGIDWNGESYVSFGNYDGSRNWEDAVKYGFISGGGGPFYVGTLGLLEPGDRVWVNIPLSSDAPKNGYVGVGEVLDTVVRASEFKVRRGDGKEVPIAKTKLVERGLLRYKGKGLKEEHLVRVKWIKTLRLEDAVWEKGFFANTNTVCKPRAKKWQHTVERLKKRFGVE